jgi:hypothetical protein
MATILATQAVTRDLLRHALSELPVPEQPRLLAHASDVAALPPGSFPEIIVLGDLRNPEAAAAVDIAGQEKLRVAYLSGPYDQADPAFNVVTRNSPPRPCLLINGAALRGPHVQLRSGRSWERLAGDLVVVLQNFPNMTVYTHLAAILSPSSAISFSFDPETYNWVRRLYYHPRQLPSLGASADAERMADFVSAGIVAQAYCSTEYTDFPVGLVSAFTAAAKEASGEPPKAVATELRSDLHARIESKSLPVWVKLPDWWGPGELDRDWTILQARYPFDYLAEDLALEVIAKGSQEAFWDVPLLEIGALATVDKREIDAFTELQDGLSDYVTTTTDDRPYNIAVFGSPGSGKSFAVTEIAKAIARKFEASGITIPSLEFDLTKISSEDDLASKFKEIEDACSPTSIPLVFWDEFDRQYGGKLFGWLEKFISPMYTKKYTLKGVDRGFGRVIFVFAGGTQETAEQFRSVAEALPELKGPDFKSRLRFCIDIPTIKHRGPKDYDNFAMLRRAMLIRTTLQRKKPDFLARALAASTSVIDPGVAKALLKITEFKAGARSIETILTGCKLATTDCLGVSDLPDETVLSAHVDLDQFHALRQEVREDWETMMPWKRGWRIKFEEDYRYKEWLDAQAKKKRIL